MVKDNLVKNILLNGGVLCLDFVNTIHDRINEPERDYWVTHVHLLQWALKAGDISSADYETILSHYESRPAQSSKLLKEAIRLRELLYNIFYSLSAGKKIPVGDLDSFNTILSKCLSHLRLKAHGKGFSQSWQLTPGESMIILVPVIYSAYELLLSDKLEKIKECSNCGWLFLDASKNGTRRWCSMNTCGSIVKAREWYHRNKGN
ncbi:MAG TPA: CGNR zinc finger domain-containing protein [Puia sp.]|nr:CGNR zinc finger domain-containing protein [Puia sp.]